mmetsp:Transcript_68871/g.125909  ORF Transcript_68871/g.125909 Transcript_68871/m.125909 type:complete len:90 (+) Transcript_68871:256-525(+)
MRPVVKSGPNANRPLKSPMMLKAPKAAQKPRILTKPCVSDQRRARQQKEQKHMLESSKHNQCPVVKVFWRSSKRGSTSPSGEGGGMQDL